MHVRQPKVAQLDVAIAAHQHVLCLEVTVNDPLRRQTHVQHTSCARSHERSSGTAAVDTCAWRYVKPWRMSRRTSRMRSSGNLLVKLERHNTPPGTYSNTMYSLLRPGSSMTSNSCVMLGCRSFFSTAISCFTPFSWYWSPRRAFTFLPQHHDKAGHGYYRGPSTITTTGSGLVLYEGLLHHFHGIQRVRLALSTSSQVGDQVHRARRALAQRTRVQYLDPPHRQQHVHARRLCAHIHTGCLLRRTLYWLIFFSVTTPEAWVSRTLRHEGTDWICSDTSPNSVPTAADPPQIEARPPISRRGSF